MLFVLDESFSLETKQKEPNPVISVGSVELEVAEAGWLTDLDLSRRM